MKSPKYKRRKSRVPRTSKSRSRPHKSKRRSATRKSRRFGSSPSRLKLEHLNDDVLQLVYDKIPKGKDRVALASASRRMNSVPYAYESAMHFIRKPADVEAAIANSAQRVTFKNYALVSELDRMKNVKYLVVENLSLDKLPTLPSKLIELNCNGNSLEKLPELPSTLIKLECSANLLQHLPALPPRLKELHCWADSLKELPQLPPTLKVIVCGANALTKLPELPPTLVELNCAYNYSIKVLPTLPKTLKTLLCDYNTKLLQPLPPKLKIHRM